MKTIIHFVFSAMLLTAISAQEEQVDKDVYVLRFIEVEQTNVAAFEAAVAEKTQRFNRSPNSDKWYTHKVITGPRGGQYVWWFGPVSWDDLDNPETSLRIAGAASSAIDSKVQHEEHKYWKENVSPLQKSVAVEVWQDIVEARAYNLPNNVPTRYVSLHRWKMKPGKYKVKTKLSIQYSKTIQETGLKINRTVSRLQSGGNWLTFGDWIGFNNWSDYGKRANLDNIGQTFDDVHGDGSFETFLTEFNEVHQESAATEAEFMMYLPALSSIPLP